MHAESYVRYFEKFIMNLAENQALKSFANIDDASILQDYSELSKMADAVVIQLDREV